MLWGPALVRSSRSFLKLGGTLGILATTWTTLHFGQLTLTLDLIVKLLITFAYTHGFANIRSKLRTPKYDPLANRDFDYGNRKGSELYAIEEKCLDGTTEEEESNLNSNEFERITATVVGWREDEDLYRRCLQGLATDPRCGPIIAGIDGDTAEDEYMVNIFLDVSHNLPPFETTPFTKPGQMFPNGIVIRLKEQLSKTLDQYMLSANLMDVETEETSTFLTDHISSFIRARLTEAISPQSIKGIQALCIVQPHQSKKDILFTALSFATVISKERKIPYLFSTDSDSMIVPGALGQIIDSLESDVNIGGVSGHLRFSHPRPTYLTRMTASHYWFEQEIPKSQGAIFGATECQPGPCAGFRVSVLKSVLVPWYCQRVFGHRTVWIMRTRLRREVED